MNLKKKLDEAKIRQAAYFQGKQDAESELLPKIERLSCEVTTRNEALEACRVKLEKLFDATGGIYHGGMEHSQLIRWIKELVSEEQTRQQRMDAEGITEQDIAETMPPRPEDER